MAWYPTGIHRNRNRIHLHLLPHSHSQPHRNNRNRNHRPRILLIHPASQNIFHFHAKSQPHRNNQNRNHRPRILLSNPASQHIAQSAETASPHCISQIASPRWSPQTQHPLSYQSLLRFPIHLLTLSPPDPICLIWPILLFLRRHHLSPVQRCGGCGSAESCSIAATRQSNRC